MGSRRPPRRRPAGVKRRRSFGKSRARPARAPTKVLLLWDPRRVAKRTRSTSRIYFVTGPTPGAKYPFAGDPGDSKCVRRGLIALPGRSLRAGVEGVCS